MITKIIDKFIGAKKNGFTWLESCLATVENGKSVIYPMFWNGNVTSAGDVGMTNLHQIVGFCERGLATNFKYGIDNYGRIFRTSGDNEAFTEYHYVGNSAYSDLGDIKPFRIDNSASILYTSRRYLGREVGGSLTDNWKDLVIVDDTCSRQIILGEDIAYIGNKNYLASIDDAGNFSAYHKKLPVGYKFQCGAYNNASLLIGMNNLVETKGAIGFWNTYSDGWNNLMPIDNPVYAAIAYENGFLFVGGPDIYFTNGYSKIYLGSFLDAELDLNDVSSIDIKPNGLAIYKNYLVINGGINSYNRKKKGIWFFNLETRDWAFYPYNKGGTNGKTYHDNYSGALFLQKETLYYGCKSDALSDSYLYYLNKIIFQKFWGEGNRDYYSVIISPFLPVYKKAFLKEIIVEVIQTPEYQFKVYPTTGYSEITLKIANPIYPLFQYEIAQALTSSTLKVASSGVTTHRAEIGDEVLFLEGANRGKRVHITSIADKATGNEVWTISPTITDGENGIDVQVFPFKKIGAVKKLSFTDNRFYFNCDKLPISGGFYIELIADYIYAPFYISSITYSYDTISDPND